MCHMYLCLPFLLETVSTAPHDGMQFSTGAALLLATSACIGGCISSAPKTPRLSLL